MNYLTACFLSCAALVAATRDAEACSLIELPRPFAQHDTEIALPANGAIFDSTCWSSGVAAARDERLSSLFGRTVQRLSPEPAVGTTFASSTCQGRSLRVASSVDLAAPSQVVIDRVRTLIVRNPASGAGLGCPELDSLEITMTTRDDVATDAQLGVLAFVGSDAASVDQATVATAVLSPEVLGDKLVVRAWLGSNGRRAGGNAFDRAGPVCFSFAAFDRAANVGMRSVTRCINSSDPSDPTVEVVQGRGGCSVRAASGRSDGASSWLTAIALAGAWIARRRASRLALRSKR